MSEQLLPTPSAFFYLVVNQVVYKETAESTEVFSQTINSIVALDAEVINAYAINVMRKSAEVDFLKIQNRPLYVIDMPFLNVIPLGNMTEAMFQHVPSSLAAAPEQPADTQISMEFGEASPME